MKPFNLEEFKAGKPAVTKEGSPARYLGTLEGSDNSIMVAIKIGDREFPFSYNSKGLIWCNVHEWDLFMVPEKKEGWVVMNSNSLHDAYNVVTREQAEKIAAARQKRCSGPDGYWKVVHITWEE